MFNDSAYNNYYHAIRHTDKKQDDIYYEINHSENPTLDLLYSYLTDLGYQMSDEELALQDGTSGYFCSRRITASETADTTAENTEFTAISSYLEACKLCDITVQYDNGVFSATDGETTWTRAEFYGFLVNDVIRLDENEKPIHGYSMPDEILQPILRYAKEAGTAIQTQKNVMDSNSAELSPTDTEKMLDRIRENYDALMTDRFYIDSEKQQIKWSYFTSSAAGGMIVEHFITFSDVRKAAKNEQEDNFYSSLLQSAVSQQTEVSEPEFQQTYYHFLVDSYDSLDADEETMEYLISCVSSDNTTDTSDVDAILESLQDMYKKVYN